MSLESLHKAEVFAESYNEYQIRSFPLSSMEKEKMSQWRCCGLNLKRLRRELGACYFRDSRELLKIL